MKNIFSLIIIIISLLGIVASPLALADDFGACSLDQGGSALCAGDHKGKDLTEVVKTVIQTISWAVGVASVVVIIYAGFLFVTSNGGDNVKKARSAITYAVIGLVVAILAYAIAGFVVNNV